MTFYMLNVYKGNNGHSEGKLNQFFSPLKIHMHLWHIHMQLGHSMVAS